MRGQRFYDVDPYWRHRALKCLMCGHITKYVERDGRSARLAPLEEDAMAHPPTCARCGFASLTVREVHALRLLARGMSNREIGHELLITEKTTKNLLTRLYKTLDVSNRTQAALLAQREGLADQPLPKDRR